MRPCEARGFGRRDVPEIEHPLNFVFFERAAPGRGFDEVRVREYPSRVQNLPGISGAFRYGPFLPPPPAIAKILGSSLSAVDSWLTSKDYVRARNMPDRILRLLKYELNSR